MNKKEKIEPVENFTRARFESTRTSKYNLRIERNRMRKEFIDEYCKFKSGNKNNLQYIANIYLLVERGTYPHLFEEKKIIFSEEDLNKIYEQIKQISEKKFTIFYESYLRKIEQKFFSEYVEEALKQAKIAYHTLRKCNNFEWECPDEMITTTEMENLYSLIKKEKALVDNNKSNKELR